MYWTYRLRYRVVLQDKTGLGWLASMLFVPYFSKYNRHPWHNDNAPFFFLQSVNKEFMIISSKWQPTVSDFHPVLLALLDHFIYHCRKVVIGDYRSLLWPQSCTQQIKSTSFFAYVPHLYERDLALTHITTGVPDADLPIVLNPALPTENVVDAGCHLVPLIVVSESR